MFLLALVIIIALGYFINHKLKIQKNIRKSTQRFVSHSKDYSYCFILWSVIAIIAIFLLSKLIILKIILASLAILLNYFLIKYLFNKNFNAKKHFEGFQILVLSLTAGVGILITLAISLSIIFETIEFFKIISPKEFFFTTNWNPQMTLTSEQEVSQSSYGVLPVFTGTLLITIIAMLVAVPVGIMSAIYLSMYAKSKTRDYLKPILEILAGIPTVVYGYFAVTIISPFFKDLFTVAGFQISPESALSAGFVMGVMIIPFILSLTDDAINAVPQSLKDGALALGSTKSEMIKKVVLITAMPNIIGAFILGFSRAIGETMIVVMSAGLIANLTINPLNSVTTATAQIVSLLVGDQEFNSPKTLSAFAIALTLFLFTFMLNTIALIIAKKYKNR
ncbi:MAG: phosphate ABC transporter permease subunit PstC [Rickettsiales bacterium]